MTNVIRQFFLTGSIVRAYDQRGNEKMPFSGGLAGIAGATSR
ncbi:MAG TPA: hypothetical protein VKZ54_13140 [Membranihabitans sp.]|nr:hypothetical protein [Membranihabitans sp.]